jgi:hypothetical protein
MPQCISSTKFKKNSTNKDYIHERIFHTKKNCPVSKNCKSWTVGTELKGQRGLRKGKKNETTLKQEQATPATSSARQLAQAFLWKRKVKESKWLPATAILMELDETDSRHSLGVPSHPQ